MGYDARTSTAEQRKQMMTFVARSMEEGAWGLVTRFESGGPEHPEEVLEMARTVARYGGNYTSHTGSEGHEQAPRVRLRHSRGRAGQDAGAHLPLQDSRRAVVGDD